MGVVQESTPIGTLSTGPNVLIFDEDYDYRDKEVGYTVLYTGGGAIELNLVREDGVTKAESVQITEGFDFETVTGVTNEDGHKIVTIPIEFSNPQSTHPQPTVHQCSLIVVNVNEPPLWDPPIAFKSRAMISFAESCLSEIGRCYEGSTAIDPDNLDIITYSTLNPFFSVAKQEDGSASICLQQTFDREEHCINDSGKPSFLPVTIRATKPKYGLFTEKTFEFKCDDINDNKPSIIFSPQPHSDMICTELERNFR